LQETVILGYVQTIRYLLCDLFSIQSVLCKLMTSFEGAKCLVGPKDQKV